MKENLQKIFMVNIYFAIVFAESLIHSTMRDSNVFDFEKQLLNVVVFATYQSCEALKKLSVKLSKYYRQVKLGRLRIGYQKSSG